jgi:hypothetical protein
MALAARCGLMAGCLMAAGLVSSCTSDLVFPAPSRGKPVPPHAAYGGGALLDKDSWQCRSVRPLSATGHIGSRTPGNNLSSRRQQDSFGLGTSYPGDPKWLEVPGTSGASRLVSPGTSDPSRLGLLETSDPPVLQGPGPLYINHKGGPGPIANVDLSEKWQEDLDDGNRSSCYFIQVTSSLFICCTLQCFFFYLFWQATVCWPLPAYVAHFIFLRYVWIRTQRAAATKLVTHLPT